MKYRDMTCEDVAGATPLYLSGELEATAREEFDAHLARCGRCRGETQALAQMDARLRQSVLAEHLDTAAVEARVRSEMRRRPAWTRWAAAAAVLIAVAGGFLYRQRAAVPEATDVYVAALRDHAREIVERQPRPWIADREDVERLAGEQGVSAPVLARLAPAGYRLEHGKLCRLNGRAYLHLVYENRGRQVSLFLRGGNEGGAARYATELGAQHLAAVRSDALSVVYVADEPSEADRLAERAAEVL